MAASAMGLAEVAARSPALVSPEQIRAVRTARRLSRLRLAALAGVHERVVQKVEQGRPVPQQELAEIVATLTALASHKQLPAGPLPARGFREAATPPESGPGWYPVVYCWDEQASVFVGAAWWSGTQWQWQASHRGCPPILAYNPARHATQRDATAAAEQLTL